MRRRFRFRVVVPRRDYRRVEWLIEERVRPSSIVVNRLFEERSDLDVVEFSFTVEGIDERRKLEKKLATSLRGSIGFFIVHPIVEGE